MSFPKPVSVGGCPASSTMRSAPGSGPACYRPLGGPVTFTSAAVSVQPAGPRNEPPGAHWFLVNFTLPAADASALTAVTTTAADAKGAIDISVAGKTWALPEARAPLTQGQFEISLPSRNQVLQLQRTLTGSS